MATADWMRYWGWGDARALPIGPDAGIDVEASGAVAQVKAHMVPVGRPDVQNLYGVAHAKGVQALFFALTSYTRQAQEWANEHEVALFRFDLQGEPAPVNGHAQKVVEGTQ